MLYRGQMYEVSAVGIEEPTFRYETRFPECCSGAKLASVADRRSDGARCDSEMETSAPELRVPLAATLARTPQT